MTELEQLRHRRELVVLAAELQRANIVRRLDRMESNPARKVLGYAAAPFKRPALLSFGSAAVRFAGRRWRRRRAGHAPTT